MLKIKIILFFKVHIQTLIPDVEPIESRKPIRQTMIEMASYLKKELSQKTGYIIMSLLFKHMK